MELQIIVPLLIAMVAPLGAYLLAARRMSGKVDTSTATELWSEARAIRSDYREQLGMAADRTRQLEERVAKLEGQNNDLVMENLALKTKVVALETLVEAQRGTIAGLEETIERLEATITRLEGNGR